MHILVGQNKKERVHILVRRMKYICVSVMSIGELLINENEIFFIGSTKKESVLIFIEYRE